jgi:hypothetical protein
MRRVCKAWQAWIDRNDNWNEYVHLYMEYWLSVRRPWSGRLSKLTVALKVVGRRGVTTSSR